MVSSDDDEAWLRAMAYQAAGPQPEAEPVAADAAQQDILIAASPLRQVHAADNVIVVDDGEGGSGLNTRGRQLGNKSGNPPPNNKRGRTAAAGSGTLPPSKKKKKDKSKSSSLKSGSTGRYRSFALDEEFVKKSYEEYMADPMAAFIHTATHLQDIANEEKRGYELRLKELEQEPASKTLAFDVVRKNLHMNTASMATLHQSAKILEQERERLMEERDAACKRVKELEAHVEKLKVSELQLSGKVADLEEVIAQQTSNSTPQDQRIAELDQSLKEAEEGNRRAARAALKMKEKGFKLALSQVNVVNPSMERMHSVLSPEFIVDEGQIVKVDPVSKAKSVIYRPS